MSRAGKTRELIQAVLDGRSPQKNYQQSFDLALAKARKLKAGAVVRLGVVGEPGGVLMIPSLGRSWQVDLQASKVTDQAGNDAPVLWAILALHYLLSQPPDEPTDHYICFMDIAEARGYAKPYQGRVVQRFLHTAGRDQQTFITAAERLAAEPIPMGDVAYEFTVFPRAHVRVIWYRGDQELPPGASFLFEQGISRMFCVEDIVVMAGELVGALSKKSPKNSRE